MPHVFNISAAGSDRHWSWVTISGPDARDFLHRLTSTHVQRLSPGQGAGGCFLNPQGKIRAYFTLWHFGLQDFAFELEAGASFFWKKELLAAIDQYTFAEKISVSDVTSLSARWLFAEPGQEAALLAALGAPALKELETAGIDEEIRVCHHGARDFGRAWITVWGRGERLDQWLGRILPDAVVGGPELLEQWRIQALRPRVDAEITAATIPLEVGLTDALAQGKGCYPGQEVIERIVSLGAPARRLVRIEGLGAVPLVGELLHNLAEPSLEVGQLTSVAAGPAAATFQALGFVRKIHAKEGLEVRIGQTGLQGVIRQVAAYVD